MSCIRCSAGCGCIWYIIYTMSPPKPWKIKVFGHLKTRLFTIKPSKHVGFGGAHGSYTSHLCLVHPGDFNRVKEYIDNGQVQQILVFQMKVVLFHVKWWSDFPNFSLGVGWFKVIKRLNKHCCHFAKAKCGFRWCVQYSWSEKKKSTKSIYLTTTSWLMCFWCFAR